MELIDALGLSTPAVVVEANALRTTAEDMLDRLRNEAAPTLDGVTAANAEDMIDKVVELELRAPLKMRHAARLAEDALTRITQAWEAAAADLRPELAKGFNDAAAKFTAEVKRLPGLDPETIGYQRSNPLYRDLFAAGDKLGILSNVRDGFAARTFERSAGLHSNTFETVTRCLRFTHMQDVLNTERAVQSRDVGFWVKMAQHPRITIHWNERDDQADMLARIK